MVGLYIPLITFYEKIIPKDVMKYILRDCFFLPRHELAANRAKAGVEAVEAHRHSHHRAPKKKKKKASSAMGFT